MALPEPVVKYAVDPLERAARTFLQQLSVILLAGGVANVLSHPHWALALDSAGFAALVSLATSLATIALPELTPPVDLLLRVVKTFIQSLCGTLLASTVTSVIHFDWTAAVAVAIPVSLTALLTGLAALGVRGTVPGASLIPCAVVDDPSCPPLHKHAAA